MFLSVFFVSIFYVFWDAILFLHCFPGLTGMMLLPSMMMTKIAAGTICNHCDDDENGEDVTSAVMPLVVMSWWFCQWLPVSAQILVSF